MSLLSRSRLRLIRPLSVPRPAPSCTSLQLLDQQKGSRERVVILGSGWAGYTLARSLSPTRYQPILVSPRTYFVFTPLLASTSVGTLEFRTTMESARQLKGVEVFRGWANALDPNKKILEVESVVEERLHDPSANENALAGDPSTHFSISYDKLVVAVGCYAQTFGIPGVKQHAFFLKDVSDARKIRRRVLERLEEAVLPTVPPERKKELLHFAVVGGGPTGVEFAAELHDLVTEDVAVLYPALKEYIRISLFDVAPQILGMFDKNLQTYARKVFSRQHIDVLTEHHVLEVQQDALITKEEGRIPVGAVVWSTGLETNPFIKNALSKRFSIAGQEVEMAKREKTGQLEVDDYLRVLYTVDTPSKDQKPLPDIFALGDCASVRNRTLPATAQVASQQASWLARTLNKATESHIVKKIEGLPVPLIDVTSQKPFRFRSLGIMAYLGGWRAITQTEKGELKGRAAWVLWRTAYLTKSLSWRNKLLIPMYWAVNWVLGRDINRF